ncbi:MAG: glycoside hydrolase family 130 protein [Isosphaeraceae bacterium]|nr:glycoside hydrolase family 130 protein [Isosphaeraceae bacterium]
MAVRVTRLPLKLRPDPRRVITRYFNPGDVTRVRGIIGRALAIPEPEVESLVAVLIRTFAAGHRDIRAEFAEHYEEVRRYLPDGAAPSELRRLWIGACFTMDYALESVALFNPSIVPAVNQEGVPPGSVRFLMSLRATGEGHVSSIVFRRGIIDRDGNLQVDRPGKNSQALRAVLPAELDKGTFRRNLQTFSAVDGAMEQILSRLGDRFTREQLTETIDTARQERASSGHFEECADTLVTVSRLNYRLEFPADFGEGEIAIFPFSDIERHGIEDLRLVRFTEDDGSFRYYGTYTAYNGVRVYPQLMEYQSGRHVDISLITGQSAKNKGMALFPRRVHGRYAMIARLDNENLYYMESDELRVWDEAQVLRCPQFPWEIIQIGNCGSPLETEAGWLLMTHGVGPMRQYCIGATLLDREDPTRVIGQTREPLLMPEGAERAGYVPNVVYSCGAMIHGPMLIVPYALSDMVTTFARIDLDELVESLEGA